MPFRQYSLFFFIGFFLVLGYLVGSTDIWDAWFDDQDPVFEDTAFDFATAEFSAIHWQQLLGAQDKQLFADLRKQQEALEQTTLQRPGEVNQMEANLLMSALKANTWQALDGYQINQDFADKWISIPGFIVPLDANTQRVSSFFIVPYFGACLHFPPPPPNQIIYVDLPQGMDLTSIDVPFMFYGKLSSELFEDPLGTSAWTMEVLKIEKYQGDTDTTRLHN